MPAQQRFAIVLHGFSQNASLTYAIQLHRPDTITCTEASDGKFAAVWPSCQSVVIAVAFQKVPCKLDDDGFDVAAAGIHFCARQGCTAIIMCMA